MISKISGDCGTNQRVSDCQSELRYHPDSGDCIIKGDLRSPSSTFYKKVKFWLFFTKKNAGILGNKEPILCLSRYKSPEIFVFVQKILILISMAGEDIGNQRFCIGDKKRVLIAFPENTGKYGARISAPFSLPKRS